ncbi:M4 family metallopeptidase, partial [Salmonella enterica]|nr:M4 family metallopeptidase [Salmonella enterica]
NRAFYLAATALDGPAWEVAGRIWYDTLRDKRLRHDADFAAFARLTLDVARSVRGDAAHKAVAGAWAAVGIQP